MNTDGAAEASMLSVPVNFAAVPDKATAARSKSKVSLLVLVTVNRNTLPDEPGVTDTAATSAVATAKITFLSTLKVTAELVTVVCEMVLTLYSFVVLLLFVVLCCVLVACVVCVLSA